MLGWWHGRYQSPRSGRASSEGFSKGQSVEGTSPYSYLRRPKDLRKAGLSLTQTGFHVRREGFDTGGSACPASGPADSLPGGAVADVGNARSSSSTASPSKAPGLLSRTFSSGVNNEAIKVTESLSFLQSNLYVTAAAKLASSHRWVDQRFHITNFASDRFAVAKTHTYDVTHYFQESWNFSLYCKLTPWKLNSRINWPPGKIGWNR